jgi:hypothetical protein
MPNKLAPIGLSAYSRLQHLQSTVAALQKNSLARDSELYIFSDAPKKGDEEKVAAVRRFLHTIDGFKSVEIFEREVNNRVANNRGGMRMLLERFGKMIFIEEDAVCAPSFLSYMNRALDTYAGDDRVFAVCGYFPPIDIPADYPYDVVMSPRMNAWAFGIWKDRFDRIEMDSRPEMFSGIFNQLPRFRNYCAGGYAVVSQLQALSQGKVDGLDIRIDYTMFRDGRMYTICPVKSLVKPIGCDGSGEHWKHASTRHDVSIDEAPTDMVLAADIAPDGRVIDRLRQFNNEALPLRAIVPMWLHWFGCYLPLKQGLDWCRAFSAKFREWFFKRNK